MTTSATAMPIEKRDIVEFARTSTNDVVAAWFAASITVRALTVGAVVAALSSTASQVVPLGTGLTIALLVPAALVDVHRRCLPDAIVLLALLTFAVTYAAALLDGTGARITHLGLGATVLAGPVLTMHLVSPRSMGFGDVKTAGVLGMAIGALAWGLAPWALLTAAASTAVVGVIGRRSTVSFGPGLVAGALSVVLASVVLGPDRIGL